MSLQCMKYSVGVLLEASNISIIRVHILCGWEFITSDKCQQTGWTSSSVSADVKAIPSF